MPTQTTRSNKSIDMEKDISTPADAEPTPDSQPRTGNSDTSITTANVAKVEQDILAHANDADAAYDALKAYGGQVIALDAATNKRLLRRIDMFIMPIMCLVYGLNYLDKTTLSYASIMGLKQPHSDNVLQSGIGISGTQYSWLSSLFYFGYLAWEYPTNRLIQRLPLGKYSAANIIIWGLVLSCFAAVNNFSGAIAIRFFLGVFEAAVTPGFALLTSQWYTKREQGLRVGIWFSFNGFAQIFGGLVAYGIAVGSERHGTVLEPWRIVFLLTGCLTIVMGIAFLIIMPDNQMNAWWLSKEDRVKALIRIKGNGQGVGNKHWKIYQFKEAFTDPLTWAFVFLALVADIPNGGISNFFSQLIVGFGYTPQQSLLYGTPGGAVEVVALIACGYFGDKIGNRILLGCSGLVCALLGMILIVALPLDNNSGRLAGYYLTQASPTAFVALLSLIASNVAGYTKKTTVAAMYLVAYCVGNIIGPQTFRQSDAPRYVPAEITIIVCWGLCILDMAFIWWYCKKQNAKKAAIRAQPEYMKLENQEFLDLTDRENPDFVYTI
ncbi:membrane transporter [Pseudovirgaria hyperparasitica]|uniref:Membrane transporter n=1 Tax=Pseudovirgaria hyperparasitica TaxID=470096 RepID=A0A6A6VVG7_9PEZI|nr:membrane transporter [Pseudovirgaria hyperparasitica]KAF2753786.1 membrane transporter [Pseudovirgaria hyperparasitica]